jgi:hypothetical protein
VTPSTGTLSAARTATSGVNGTLTELASGAPIANAIVTVGVQPSTSCEGWSECGTPLEPVASTTSAANGTFTLLPLLDGEYFARKRQKVIPERTERTMRLIREIIVLFCALVEICTAVRAPGRRPGQPGAQAGRSALYRLPMRAINIAALPLLAALVSALPAGAQSAAPDLLRRATDPNPGLQSYTAKANLSATLHVLIPVHKSYDGTVYYLKPKRKISFQGVSGALSKFRDLVTSTPTYDDAAKTYTISMLHDDGSDSSYSLVPKSSGSRVKSLTLFVNDRSGLIDHAQWSYTNGGTLSFDETYEAVGTYRLPAKADIAARFPGYSVDGAITFSAYVPNAPVSPSVFATPKS